MRTSIPRSAGRKVAAAVGAALLITAMAACSSNSGGTTSAGGKDIVVKVGVVQANNAVFTLQSGQVKTAAEVGAKLIKAPAGYKIEQFPIDTDGTPAGAVKAVGRAVQQDGIQVVTGFLTSAISGALGAQAKQLGIVILDSNAKDASLTAAACSSNYFRVSDSSSQDTKASVAIGDTVSAQTWDIVGPDNAYGHGVAAAFSTGAKTAGATIQNQVFTADGTTDFSPYISSLATKPADALLVISGGADAVNLAKQAQDFGLFKKYKLVLSQGLILPNSVEAAGAALIGIQEIYPWTPDSTNTGSKEFVTAYNAASKATVWYSPAGAYTAMQIALQAAEKAKSVDPDKLIKALAGGTFDTIGGKIELRAADHQAIRDLELVQVENVNGTPTVVTKKAISSADVTVPVDPACKLG